MTMTYIFDEASVLSRENLSRHFGMILERYATAHSLSSGEREYLENVPQLLDELRLGLGETSVLERPTTAAAVGAATSTRLIDLSLGYAFQAMCAIGVALRPEAIRAKLGEYSNEMDRVLSSAEADRNTISEMARFFREYNRAITGSNVAVR
jgi:hypothetical protein